MLWFWSLKGRLLAATFSVWEQDWEGPGIALRRPIGGEGPGRLMEAANGFLWLGMVRPGWILPDMEVHGAWEENLLLRRDLCMPGRGVMGAGMQLANPAGHWHGPMASWGGALFLIHTDDPKDVTYRPQDGAREELLRYLETAPW